MRRSVWIALATVVLFASTGSAQAARKRATLDAPYDYGREETCGPRVDRTTGRVVADPRVGDDSCVMSPSRVGTAWLGSESPLRETRSLTATLHIDRMFVPSPLADTSFHAMLIAGEDPQESYDWCADAPLMTPEEHMSPTPVTVLDRDIQVTCSTALLEAWAGIYLHYTNGVNPVELDATVTKIMVRSGT